MDLASVAAAAEEGAVMEVKDPAGEPMVQTNGKPVWIKFAGTESERWRKARNSVGNRYLKTAEPRRQPGPRTAEEGIADLAFQYASATLAWEGIVDEGQEIEFNIANAKRIYSKYEFLRQQIDEFLGEKRNFWKAS
jgi:hypothetical protein